MTSTEPGAFLSIPGVNLDRAHIEVSDRTADLGCVVVRLSQNGGLQLHVDDPETARAFALAFARATDMLTAAQEPEPEPPAGDLPDSKLIPAADYVRDTATALGFRPAPGDGDPGAVVKALIAPLTDPHGENHIGGAGQVVPTAGACITCHGTVSGAGVFTSPAVTA